MSHTRPRQEFQFPTIKDRPDLDFIPAKSRDKRLIELLTDKPRGYRTVWQQRIATEASSATVDELIAENDIETLRSVSDVLAIVALGTAYHTFGEPESEDLAFRRIKIAKMVDHETKTRTTTEELVASVQSGLADAALLAAGIDERTLERRNVIKDNDKLGRALATVGFKAAALHDGLDKQEGSEVDLQHSSWISARAASRRALQISDSIGSRLTMSGLADTQSPTVRFIHDNPWFVPAPAFEILTEKIDMARADAFERYDKTQMLFT